MVDKKSSNQLVRPSIGSSSKSLISGLKSLSSGSSVFSAVNTAKEDVLLYPEEQPAPEVIGGLFAAVRFSREALWAIQRVAARPSTADLAVMGVVHDLDKLRDEILSLVTALEERAETAEVVRENFEASRVQLSDLNRAWETAQSIGQVVQVKTNAVIDAHVGLTPERVAELLKED